jgi:hypothetical protein
MAIITSPPSLIFINNDLTAEVLSVFVRQLFITYVIDKQTFDGYVSASDGYYPLWVHQDGYRVLVVLDLSDQTNRQYADIVLCAKQGLVSALANHYGPPALTTTIDRCYLTQLIYQNKIICAPYFGRKNIYDYFLGHPSEAYNRDYRRYILDWPRPTPPEPADD